MHTVTRIALPMIGALLLFAANPASADPAEPRSCPVINGALACGGGGGDDNYPPPFGITFDGIIKGLMKPFQDIAKYNDLDNRASAAFDAGDYADAAILYRAALRLRPGDEYTLHNLMASLDGEGLQAARNGDFDAAINFYQQALQASDDPIVRANLQAALDHNAPQAPATANSNDDDLLTVNDPPTSGGDSGNTGGPAGRTGSLAGRMFASSLHQAGPITAPAPTDSAAAAQTAAAEPPAASTTAPDFHDADHDAPADKPSGTASGSGAAEANTDGEASNMFGEKNSGGGGLAQGSSATTPPAHSFGEEASSVAASGKNAQTFANAAAKNANPLQLQIAKADSNCGFDTANCAVGTSVSSPEDHVTGQTPGAAALASRIPDVAKDDKDIQLTLQWYQTLDGQKIGVQQRLAKVQADINNKNGDAADLAKEKSILSAQVTQLQKDETSAQGQIETRLQSHFHIPLLAAASESADGGKAKGPAEAKATDNNK